MPNQPPLNPDALEAASEAIATRNGYDKARPKTIGQSGNTGLKGKCGHNGGQGIGAGHTCTCVRTAHHSLASERPHGCSCGAAWKD